MKSTIRLLLKLFLATFSFGVFYILEYGFNFDSYNKLLTPFLLSTLTMIMLFRPDFKRYSLILTGVCLVLMILLSIFNLLNFANVLGSFGFSLLIVTIFLYLPQIVKKGHIERF